MTNAEKLLLDTNAALFVLRGRRLLPAAQSAIDTASGDGRLFLSAVSAWEIGLLMARGRLKSPLSAVDFFLEAVNRFGCKVCEVTAPIFANSSFLPHFDHRDPADCLLIATARALDLTIVTSDRKILGYGIAGHVKSMAC